MPARRSKPAVASLALSDFMRYDASTLHVRSHESTRLEFKESYESRRNARYLKTLAAFSNNRGGALLFGVSNNPRTIVGADASTMPDVADWQNRLRSYFDPAIAVEVHEFKLKKQTVVVVSVPQGASRPYICTRDATEIVIKSNKTVDQSVLQQGTIYFRYAGSTLPIRSSELREIIHDTVQKDINALHAEQVRTQRAELYVVALRSTSDNNSQITNWQIVIGNRGPAEARNLRMRLLSIHPSSPKYWRGGYFPYDVRRVSIMHNPEWAGIDFALLSGSEETFQLFQSWLSSAGELMVVGLDARRIDEHRLMEHMASISASERWRLHYEVIAVNSETVNFDIYVYVKSDKVAAEMTVQRSAR